MHVRSHVGLWRQSGHGLRGWKCRLMTLNGTWPGRPSAPQNVPATPSPGDRTARMLHFAIDCASAPLNLFSKRATNVYHRTVTPRRAEMKRLILTVILASLVSVPA